MRDSPPSFDTNNSLLDLRIAILKSISVLWTDDYTESPVLRNQLINYTSSELKEYFRDSLNYDMPFQSFGLKYIDSICAWNLYGDQTWSKPDPERLVISLPELPTCILNQTCDNVAERTKYLMQYYQHFPNFFGTPEESAPYCKVVEEYPEEQPDNCDSPIQLPTLLAGIDSSRDINNFSHSGDQEDLGLAEDTYLNFGAVMIRLIAAAWENPSLLQKLNYKNWLIGADVLDEDTEYEDLGQLVAAHSFSEDTAISAKLQGVNNTYQAYVIAVLKNHFNYECPWDFDLVFVIPEGEQQFWQAWEEGDSFQCRWRRPCAGSPDFVRNWLQYSMPQAPAERDKGRISTALAGYNCTGPAYPLTCS